MKLGELIFLPADGSARNFSSSHAVVATFSQKQLQNESIHKMMARPNLQTLV